MSDSKTLKPMIESTPFQTQPTQNVQGWERIGSLAGGVVMMGKGIRRGGFFGLIQIYLVEGLPSKVGVAGRQQVFGFLEGVAKLVKLEGLPVHLLVDTYPKLDLLLLGLGLVFP